MVFEDDKILFFHPGKCAGTSIEEALSQYFLGEELPHAGHPHPKILYGWNPVDGIYMQHADIEYVLNHTNIDVTQYTSYTFVRNPYHRIVSAYNFPGNKVEREFNDFVLNPLGLLLRYERNSKYTTNHFGLMSRFTHHPKYMVDYIGKVENMEEDFKRFFPKAVLPNKKLQSTAQYSIHKNYMDYYSPEAKKRVYELYEEDFLNFGYSY